MKRVTTLTELGFCRLLIELAMTDNGSYALLILFRINTFLGDNRQQGIA